MFACSKCAKEISFQSAVLNQDLSANTVAFCSVDCQKAWYVTLFDVNLLLSKAIATRTGAAPLARGITAFDALRSVAQPQDSAVDAC